MISVKRWSGGILGDGITLSRDQRRTVGRRAFVDFLRHPWRVAAFLGVQIVPVLLLLVVGLNAVPLLIGPTDPVYYMMLIMIIALLLPYAALMLTAGWAVRRAYGPHLRRAVRDRPLVRIGIRGSAGQEVGGRPHHTSLGRRRRMRTRWIRDAVRGLPSSEDLAECRASSSDTTRAVGSHAMP